MKTQANNNRILKVCGRGSDRNGVVLVAAVVCLAACLMFTAFAVDMGMIGITQIELQNGVDAAALAGAMEITHAVENAGEDVEDAMEYARSMAAAKAVEVAALNGIFVDPDRDIEFGHRYFDEAQNGWTIEWGASNSNVVRVTARRDNTDVAAEDGQLPLPFASVFGDETATLSARATGYVEARDIVTVLDFSRSMNFDSYFADEYQDPNAQLPQAEIEANLLEIWEDLEFPAYGNMPFNPDWVTVPSVDNGEVEVTWRSTAVDIVANDYDNPADFAKVYLKYSNGSGQYFTPSGSSQTFQGTGSNAGRRITSAWVKDDNVWEEFNFYNNNTIKRGLDLDGVPYPYPVGSWDRYIEMARDHSPSMTSYYQAEIYNKGYRRKFGVLTFLHYLLRFESGHSETPDLWMTRHYPFHAVKEGHTLFCDFLKELNFGDHTGLVSYDTYHRVEVALNETGMPSVDISGEPLTNDYDSVATLMQYKQAAHHAYATNMGGGLKDGKTLLEEHGRDGARPTILLMTDGNTNTMDSGESSTLPSDWNWDELLDYDGDGEGDFETSSAHKRYVLKLAKECLDAGITIHTMSVGADADRELMEAIAHLGRGIWIDIPGGTSITEMESNVRAAFEHIAASVPPATLLNDEY
jgi:hypothetical protein